MQSKMITLLLAFMAFAFTTATPTKAGLVTAVGLVASMITPINALPAIVEQSFSEPIPDGVYIGEVTMSSEEEFLGTNTTDTGIAKRAGRGHAAFQNACQFDIFINICWQSGPGIAAGCYPSGKFDSIRVPARGGRYAENYWYRINNGRSIKASPIAGNRDKPQLQLEYTLQNANTVFYDVSNVDGDPFRNHNFGYWNSNPRNFHTQCRAPSSNCPGVFPLNNPVGGLPYPESVNDSFGVYMCLTIR